MNSFKVFKQKETHGSGFNQFFSSYFMNENICTSVYKGSSLKSKKWIEAVGEVTAAVLIKISNAPLNLGKTIMK
jgi:hypothetical protein